MLLRNIPYLRKYGSLPAWKKVMLLEALVRVGAAYIVVKFTPYRFWQNFIGKEKRSTHEVVALSQKDKVRVDNVAWAHGAIERKFGTRFTCLMLAISASGMLRRRGIRCSVILGVITRDGADCKMDVRAHAWVCVGERVVIGGDGMDRFTVVAAYH